MSGLAVVPKSKPAGGLPTPDPVASPNSTPVKEPCLCHHTKSDHNLKHPMGCHKCPCTVFQPLVLKGGARGDSRSEVRSSTGGER